MAQPFEQVVRLMNQADGNTGRFAAFDNNLYDPNRRTRVGAGSFILPKATS
jgi:hypothetical protein